MPRAWCGRPLGALCQLGLCGTLSAAGHVASTVNLSRHNQYRVADTDLYIFFSEEEEGEGIQRWLQPLLPPTRPLVFLPQCQSPNLGDRLLHALEVVLARGHTIAMVSGSDVPDLSAHHFEAALAAVRPPAQYHATFGPAADGGYYLLALRSPSQSLPQGLFDGIVWSASDVLKASLAAAEQSGLAVAPLTGLPVLRDIDTHSDLEAWAAAAKAAIKFSPREGMAAASGKQHQQELLALACSILTASRGKQEKQQL